MALKELTIQNIREVLWEEAQRVREDKTTPASCNALTNNFSTIIRTVKLEMDYYKATGKAPTIPLMDSSLIRHNVVEEIKRIKRPKR